MDEAWKAVKSGIYAVFRCRFGIYQNVQCWDGKDKIFFSRPELRGKNMAGALTIGEPAKHPAVYLNPCITLEKSNANTV